MACRTGVDRLAVGGELKTKTKSTAPTRSVTKTPLRPAQPFFGKKSTTSSETSVQSKLIHGKPGDPLERQADAVADHVTHGSATATAHPLASDVAGVQRQADASLEESAQAKLQDEEQGPLQAQLTRDDNEPAQAKLEDDESLQTKAEDKEQPPIQAQVEEESVQARVEDQEEPVQAQAAEDEPAQAQLDSEGEEPVRAKLDEDEPVQALIESPAAAPPDRFIRKQLRARRGFGSPLPDAIRSRMEAQIGADFSGVRIHTDDISVQLSRLLKAKAFTRGRDIYFGKGRFRPGTREGDHLLAHELTHTVQQGAVESRELQLKADPAAIQRKEEDDGTFMIRPELLEAIRIARTQLGKVNAKMTDPDGTRVGWERLYDYFVTAFGKEVIHESVIRNISHVTAPDGKRKDAMPSWCGIFVWWAYKSAGIPIPDWEIGANIFKWVRVRKPGELPQKGDIAYKEPNSHFALVTGVEGPESRAGKSHSSIYFGTVNGNTAGDDNLGGQIQEKWEPISKWLAFFDPIANLDLPDAPLVPTSVEPDEFIEGEGAAAEVPGETVPETEPTDVDALYGEVVSESMPPAEGATDVGVELPAEPAPPGEEKVAEIEAVSFAGSSDEAMVGFVQSKPSQMAVSQPDLGPKLNDKMAFEQKDEVENAPVLKAQTTGKVEEGITLPDQIPVPGDAAIGDGTAGPERGGLIAEPHANTGATPTNEENERLLDEKDRGGGFLDWLRNNIRSFLQRVRTTDPGLNTRAGKRPNVTLDGKADPGRMKQQRDDANTELVGQRDTATDSFKKHPGQSNIQAKKVDEERDAKPSAETDVSIDTPKNQGVADYAEAPLPADVRSKADEMLEPGLSANLAEAKASTEGARKKKDVEKATEVSKAESEAKRISSSADKDQRDVVVQNRKKVAQQQKAGIEEAYGHVNQFNKDADAQQQQARKDIGDKVKDSEKKAREELDKGEADAEKKKKEGEKEAAEKKKELEKKQKKKSWWDRAVGAIKSAVKAITKAIDAVFTRIRNAVKTIIEKAKNLAIGLINAARDWVIDKLNKFRDWAKGLVDKYLKDHFPGLAAKINGAIDAVVDTAIDGVNYVADKAVAAVEALANKLAAALDRILGAFQTALKAAVQIAGAVLTGDFAEALRVAIQAACDIAGIDSKPLFDFVDRAASLVMKILKDPKSFFNNVMKAIGGGVRNFAKNIKKHLIKGLIGWLTGALSEVDIQLPDKFDVRGIFSLVMQILGLTYENIKARVIKRYPPAAKVIAAIEKGVEIIRRIVTEGPSAIWDMIKEAFANLKEMVLGAIRSFVITTVVKEAITWVLGLLNPAGAIVKILKLVYDFIMFLVERFNQIKDFVLSVYNSIAAIANGALSKATLAVEEAMSRSLPVVISLLARLAGLGGIGKEVKKIIGKVTTPINKAIDKVVDKVIKFAKKLFKKGKVAAKRAGEKVKELLWPKKKFKAGGETHTLSISKSGAVMIATTPQTIEAFLASVEKEHGSTLTDTQKGHLTKARAVIKTLKGIARQKKTDANKRKMLEHEVTLSNHVRLFIDERGDLLDAKEKYKLEGMGGTFQSMEKFATGDQFTADHQPQHKLFEIAAEKDYFKKAPDQRMIKHAHGRSRHAYAINLHHLRHKAGRTHSSKGTATAKAFRSAISGVTGSDKNKRDKVVGIIKGELSADVSAMRGVVGRGDADPVWSDIGKLNLKEKDRKSLIKDIASQVRDGESKIAAQDLDSLKK